MTTPTPDEGWRGWANAFLHVTPTCWLLDIDGGPQKSTTDVDLHRDAAAWADIAVAYFSHGNLIVDGPWTTPEGQPFATVAVPGGNFSVIAKLKTKPYAWADRLTGAGIPADGKTVERVIRVSSNARSAAIVMANLVPAVVEALADPDLADAPSSALYDLVGAIRKLRGYTATAEERLVADWKDRDGDDLSWAKLGAALAVDRSTAKAYYLRIKAAQAQGLTAWAVEREATAAGQTAVALDQV